MYLKSKEALELARCQRGQFQQLYARNSLRTKYDDPGQGKARSFSKENVIELALLTAFLKGGASVSVAHLLIDTILRNIKIGKQRNWFVTVPGTEFRSGKTSDDIEYTFENYDEDVLTGVNVRKILKRIDDAFESGTQPSSDDEVQS